MGSLQEKNRTYQLAWVGGVKNVNSDDLKVEWWARDKMRRKDLFDLGYGAVGEFSPNLEIITAWEEPFRKGVIYTLRDNRVRGVLLWNIWDKIDEARQLIAEEKTWQAKEVRTVLTS